LFGLQRFVHRTFRPLDPLINGEFLVESRSNDDVGHTAFINNIAERYRRAGPKHKGVDLIAAFCPAREARNDCLHVLQSRSFQRFDEVHVVLLQYKWDWHAELRLPEVKRYLRQDRRVTFHLIDHDKAVTTDAARLAARDNAVRAYLRRLYP
jgi:hypothetical protein